MNQVYPSAAELVSTSSDRLCADCNLQFANRGALRMHRVKKHGQLEKPTDSSLYSRLNVVKSPQYQFHCPQGDCSKAFSTKRLLSQHYCKVHGEKSHECPECRARFALERDLKYHRKKLCVALGDSRLTVQPKRPKRPTHNNTTTSPAPQSTAAIETRLVALPCIVKPVQSHREVQTDLTFYAQLPNHHDSGHKPRRPPEPVLPSTQFPSPPAQPPEVSTSDFAGQYGTTSYDRECQFTAVTTFDQGTMYEHDDANPYYGQLYYADASNSAATQTYLWPPEPYTPPTDFAPQQHTSTQTGFEPLEQWFGRSQEENLRDFAGMTDPSWFL